MWFDMEGLLCGKQIVTTPTGGISELNYLESILFSEPENSKDLSDKIEQCLFNSALHDTKARLEGKRFSIKTIALDFVEMYKELTAK